MIIGITGTLGAGKGTIVEYLKEKGFIHQSARAFVTEEIVRRNIDINRDNMVMIANEMRKKYGPNYIAEQLYERGIKKGKDIIIESIRTVAEAEALKKKGDFLLLAVDADPKLRYERVSKRGTETDNISFEKFFEDEKKEMTSDDPTKQNLSACIKIADRVINNDSTIEELHKKVESVTNDKTKLG
ncbi:AAA family ATPase [Desulfosarcina sp.]|nr:AAA family ATPase [Desulfosarcina sp.]